MLPMAVMSIIRALEDVILRRRLTLEGGPGRDFVTLLDVDAPDGKHVLLQMGDDSEDAEFHDFEVVD